MADRLLADLENMGTKAGEINRIMANETKIVNQTNNLFKGLTDGWQGSDEEILAAQSNELVRFMKNFNDSLSKMATSIKNAGSQLSSKDAAAASYFKNLY